jgi:hypothetical protein
MLTQERSPHQSRSWCNIGGEQFEDFNTPACVQFHFRSGWLTTLSIAFEAWNAVSVPQQVM